MPVIVAVVDVREEVGEPLFEAVVVVEVPKTTIPVVVAEVARSIVPVQVAPIEQHAICLLLSREQTEPTEQHAPASAAARVEQEL